MDNNNLQGGCQPFSVYVMYCNVTGLYYVGVTSREVIVRINEHRYKRCQFVDKEIQKIGWENFDWWIVEENISANMIDEREKYWIEFFDCVYPKGYNRTDGSRNPPNRRGAISPTKGKKRSPETCEKMRQAKLGKKLVFSEEHKAHMRKPKSEIHRRNISKSKLGEKNPMYGKEPANKGKKHSEETKNKIRQAKQKSAEERRALLKEQIIILMLMLDELD